MDVFCVFPFIYAKLPFIDINLLQVLFSTKKKGLISLKIFVPAFKVVLYGEDWLKRS